VSAAAGGVRRDERLGHLEIAVDRHAIDDAECPGPSIPANIGSLSRFSGQSIFSIESSKRLDPRVNRRLSSNFPTVLFCRNGAVDQALMSEAGRMKPRPPPEADSRIRRRSPGGAS
jgi:hypothetical protein